METAGSANVREEPLDGPDRELLEAALQARSRAYAPYSGFAVGAAVRTADGRIFAAGNIENASYPATICAERVAASQAVAAGVRHIVAVAVVAGSPGPCAPCGVCRQFLREFGPQARIIMANLEGRVEIRSLQELLPLSFGPGDLGRPDSVD
ncbi:MAG: cytidine deaminase [Firmicutes bacterium]|nr:cytidine deaminase [Bacillota bacterium]